MQAIEVTALPEQSEIQRVAVHDWGVQNPVLKLDIAATIPDLEDRAVYRLQTQLKNQSEIQLLQLRPAAFVREIQIVSLDAYLSEVDERSVKLIDQFSDIVINCGLWNISLPWDATENQMTDALLSIPVINSGSFDDNNAGYGNTGVSVTKLSIGTLK